MRLRQEWLRRRMSPLRVFQAASVRVSVGQVFIDRVF
jgi:hypothetical protein